VVRLTPANWPQGFLFELMKKTILLVDDDPGVRRMLQRVLEEEDYVVVPAADGLEALERAKTAAPDLVLLDLNLPMQNGWDTFERLTTENPLLAVIIITARPNQLFPALASGAGALMEKPLDLPKLLRTIRDLLAEPAESRLARMAGERAEFHYLPPTGREPAAKR
jgi:CheY-like chemotaxis protein